MFRQGKWARRLGLGLAYLVVAAAAFCGFYQKTGFHDASRYISAASMLDGSIIRPFVYRRLDPWIATAVADTIPAAIQQTIYARYAKDGVSGLGPDIAIHQGAKYYLEYNILYYISFAQLLAALFVLRGLFQGFVGRIAATVTPAIVALLMPILQATNGGFFYDYSELLFLSLAALAAARGWMVPLAAVTVLGSLNKEAFFFFIPALAPFLSIGAKSRVRTALTLGLMLLVSGSIYLALKAQYGSNPGRDTYFSLFANLRFYADPRNLFRFEKPYGLFMPRPYSLFWIAAAAGVVLAAWRRAAPCVRRHAALALAINLPLVLLFCAPGEMRDFGLCVVGFGILMAYTVEDAFVSDAAGARLKGPA